MIRGFGEYEINSLDGWKLLRCVDVSFDVYLLNLEKLARGFDKTKNTNHCSVRGCTIIRERIGVFVL